MLRQHVKWAKSFCSSYFYLKGVKKQGVVRSMVILSSAAKVHKKHVSC